MLELIGFLVSMLAGVLLGLLGGGGSILAVPVLVYLFQFDLTTATLYSLFIIGVSSLGASISNARNKLLNLKIFFLFGIPSVITVFLVRAYILPAIPEEISMPFIGDFSKRVLLLLLFSSIMILAAYAMIRKNRVIEPSNFSSNNQLGILALQGIVTGALTALVGAGGGFLIVPALVMIAGLDMKKAVGTSLLIVATQSLTGFAFDGSGVEINWELLLLLTAITILGMQLGLLLSKKLSAAFLRPFFGWFVAAMAVIIAVKELFFPV